MEVASRASDVVDRSSFSWRYGANGLNGPMIKFPGGWRGERVGRGSGDVIKDDAIVTLACLTTHHIWFRTCAENWIKFEIKKLSLSRRIGRYVHAHTRARKREIFFSVAFVFRCRSDFGLVLVEL